MTEKEFRAWPFLLYKRQVLAAVGYSNQTLRKMVECGVLVVVRPAGADHRRYQKVQLAKILRLSIEGDLERFSHEPLLMSEKSVVNWTGYGGKTLHAIAGLGGIHPVRLAGLTNLRYQQSEIAQLIGFP